MRVHHALLIAVFCLIAGLASATLGDGKELPRPEQVIEVLRSGDFVARQRTLDALAADRQQADKYAPALRLGLKDKDRAVRQQAAIALAAFGFADQPILDELLAGMARRHPGRYHSQPEDALSAKWALVKLGAKAVPALIKAQADESYAVRLLALQALGEIGPVAKEALPAIERALAKDDPESLVTLVEVKWRIDGDAAFALERLLPLLEDKRNLECDGALKTLVHMGKDAEPAMPALVACLKRHADSNVLWAVSELAPHSKKLAIAALRENLSQPDLADDAAIALHRWDVPAEEVTPSQLRRLRKCQPKDGSNPRQIVYSIILYDAAARPCLPELLELLKHRNPEVRRAVAWGLCRIGDDDQRVEAPLTPALQDAEVTEEAGKSLEMLQGSPTR
jgi:HEAT repeat protein